MRKGERQFEQRIRQQEIMSELGVLGLQGASLAKMLDETVRLTAEGLRVQFCKVLRYMPEDNRLLVEAGVGWGPGIVGVASLGVDLESPAGFALRTGNPSFPTIWKTRNAFALPRCSPNTGSNVQ